MTVLVQDRNTPWRDGEMVVLQVAANARIFAGSLVCANATGFATPGAVSTSLAYIGMADEFVDNTGGADGALSVRVRRFRLFKWANEATDLVTLASIGRPCFVVDNQTVAKTNGTNTRSQAGIVLSVEPDGVWVF